MAPETIWTLLPEVLLVVFAVAIYLGGAFAPGNRPWGGVAGGGLILAAVALWRSTPAGVDSSLELDSLADDTMAYFGRWLALLLGSLLVMLSARSRADDALSGSGAHNDDAQAERIGSLLLVIVGLMLVCGAAELVLLFVALELISIPTYILLYLGRLGINPREAATKYFFLSIFASGILLYGFSFLYGTTGTTDMPTIAVSLAHGTEPSRFAPMVKLAFVLIFAGLGFKIAAVPFHFYAADVYQGTTHTNAALLSVVPKAAGMIVLLRLLTAAAPSLQPYAWHVAITVAAVTMTFGNILALWQENFRRLLAYSSVAHAGYMLVGLAVGLAARGTTGKDGIAALLFYLCVYTIATIGAFAVLQHLGRRSQPVEDVDELAGLGQTHPMAAATLGIFMFSLAGIPPLAGFWGKFVLFKSALDVAPGPNESGQIRVWFITLAVIGMLNAAVAAAYYLRIIAVMYFRVPLATLRAEGTSAGRCTIGVCAVLVILLGLLPGPLLSRADRAGDELINGRVSGHETPQLAEMKTPHTP